MKLDQLVLLALTISSTTAHVIQARQNSGSSTGTAIATSVKARESTTVEPTNSDSSDAAASSTGDVSNISKSPTTTSQDITASSSTVGTVASSTGSSNTTLKSDPTPLPLPPKRTVAVIFTGVTLLGTGLVYGPMGINNKKSIYRFFGPAYLGALCITLLILFLMNPPASNKIQGVYFVAATLTGLACGCVGVVAGERMESLGCALGGFCLAMWFLCLKQGGLIESQTGVRIFIACFTVAVFLLWFIGRYTSYKFLKRWTVIASIHFSGASATILGIDCFSEAGLKEMWIYVWAINDLTFPLGTTTYPITRGMRVESAGVIALVALGLWAHYYLSKATKQKEREKESVKRQRQEALEREALETGQLIEDKNRKELQKWEGVYGGGKRSSVTLGAISTDSMGKLSENRLSTGKEVEMSQMSLDKMKRASKEPRVTVTGAGSDTDEIQPVEKLGDRDALGSKRGTLGARPISGGRPASTHSHPSDSARSSTAPPAPEVVPLPFKIPGVEMDVPSTQGSMSAIEEMVGPRKTSSRRNSAVPATWKRTSMGPTVHEVSRSEEDLIIPNDTDKASSVAATLDGMDDEDMLSEVSLPRSPLDANFSHRSPAVTPPLEGNNSEQSTISDKVGDLLKTAGPTPAVPEKSAKRNSFSELRLSMDTTPAYGSRIQTPDPSPSSRRPGAILEGEARAVVPALGGSSDDEKFTEARSTKTQSDEEPSKSHRRSLREHLSDQTTSKVAVQYRTNEWAKHITEADEPEGIAVQEPPSPGIMIDTNSTTKSEEHTPISPIVDPDKFIQPLAVPQNRLSATSSNKLSGISETPNASSGSQSKRSSFNHQQQLPRTQSDQSVPTLNSQHSGDAQQPISVRNSRNMSTPQLACMSTDSTSSERPERLERMGTFRQVGTEPIPQPQANSQQKRSSLQPQGENLLDKRQNRISTNQQNIAFAQSSPNLIAAVKNNESTARLVGLQGNQDQNEDEDDIPLAIRRRSLLAEQDKGKRASTQQQSRRSLQPENMHGPERMKPERRISGQRQDSQPPLERRISSQSRLDNFAGPSRPASLNRSVITLGNFDSHQPQRDHLGNKREVQAERLTNFRHSLRQEIKSPERGMSAEEVRRARMIHETRQERLQREEEMKRKSKKDEEIEHGMRNGGMIDRHRKALERMQSDVKE